jgi:hypothetical protein
MHAQVVSAMPPSPHKNIRVNRLNSEPNAYPDIFQHSDLASLSNNAFVIHNDDSRNVIGICAVWLITDDSNKVSTRPMMIDIFLNTIKSTVITPGGSMIISPAGWQVPACTSSVTGQAFLKTTPGLIRSADQLAHATQVALTIDSVIFEDGEIWGPNMQQIDKQIVGRKAAAVDVSQLVRRMISSNGDWRAMLTENLKKPMKRDDYQARWKQRFGQQLLTSSGDPTPLLNYFDNLPAPGTFTARQ